MNSFKSSIVLSLILVLSFSFCIRIYTVYLSENVYHYNYKDDNYKIKTDYKPSNKNDIDYKVRNIIKNSKRNKTDLVLKGSTKKYKNYMFTHVSIVQNKKRKELSYIYDKHNKYYKLEDFIKNKTCLNILKRKIDNNYNGFYFNKKGLVFIYDKSKTTLPFSEINNLLKEKYRKKGISLPEIRDIEGLRNKKLLCFTFDDGPNTETTKILLDNLNKYNARVSFFVLGMRVDSNKEVLKRAYLMGNDIGSHTYGHKDLLSLSDKNVLKEINKTNEEIDKVIGKKPSYIRPPFGSINEKKRKLYDMKTILWNVDSIDWMLKDRNKIKKEILKHAEEGNIILVHDIYEESVYGALMAMEELKKEGYEFVTISEMAYLKNITLNNNKSYFGF